MPKNVSCDRIVPASRPRHAPAKFKWGAHFCNLTGMWIFLPITVHRTPAIENHRAKLGLRSPSSNAISDLFSRPIFLINQLLVSVLFRCSLPFHRDFHSSVVCLWYYYSRDSSRNRRGGADGRGRGGGGCGRIVLSSNL